METEENIKNHMSDNTQKIIDALLNHEYKDSDFFEYNHPRLRDSSIICRMNKEALIKIEGLKSFKYLNLLIYIKLYINIDNSYRYLIVLKNTNEESFRIALRSDKIPAYIEKKFAYRIERIHTLEHLKIKERED